MPEGPGAAVPEAPGAGLSGADASRGAAARRTGASGGAAEGEDDAEGVVALPVGGGTAMPGFAPDAWAVGRDAARCTGWAGVVGVDAGAGGAAGAPGAGEDGVRAEVDSGRCEGGSPVAPLLAVPDWVVAGRTGAPDAGAPPRVGAVPSPGRFSAGPSPGLRWDTDRWTGVPDAVAAGGAVGGGAAGEAAEGRAGGVEVVPGAGLPTESRAERCTGGRGGVSPSRAGAAEGCAGRAGAESGPESGAAGVPVAESRVAGCTVGRGGVAGSCAGAAGRGAGADGGTEDDRRAAGVAAGPSPLARGARCTGVPDGVVPPGPGGVAPPAWVAPGRAGVGRTGGAAGEAGAEGRCCGRTARCTGASGAGAEAGACAGAGAGGVVGDGQAVGGASSARAAGEAPRAGAEPGSARSPSGDEGAAVPDGPGAELVRRLAGRARRCTAGVPEGALVSA
ncbi:hypothetical protein [Streptomyces parvulus]|uniref:hypothetical protein n=1 Tax=Streptomyces parvulus TaxID=146923 RepID=UPI003691AD6B